MGYAIEIAATNVPETLEGAPVAAEIISPTGRSRRVLLPLSSERVDPNVEGPG